MFVEHVYDLDLAQAICVIGCQRTSQTVVVDARRDVGTYLDEARREGRDV